MKLCIIYKWCMVLSRIFGPRRDEVTGEWRRLHNKELNDLYSSPNIVRVIKLRRMRWAGHVARMGEERGCVASCKPVSFSRTLHHGVSKYLNAWTNFRSSSPPKKQQKKSM